MTDAHPPGGIVSDRTARIDWLLFILLGFMWGSSYLFIKIGVDQGLPPFTLITLRLAIGFVLLASVVAYVREPLPREPRIYGHLLVMGVVNIAIPFALITFAEQAVDSSLASVINSSVPLFVIVVAAIFLKGETITVNRVVGLAIGFVGVAILVGFDIQDLGSANTLGELALVGSSISYSCGAVYAKAHIHGLRPMIPAVFQVGFALVIVTILAFVFERPFGVSFTTESIMAVVWLGLLGSGVAYLAFFRILGRWGATRTSLVAYLLPVYGIALGALVLREPIATSTLVGAGLVIGGIAVVNSRYGARPLFARRNAAGVRASTGARQT
jgi:drug/metabolite transporter (DMT)-like permease